MPGTARIGPIEITGFDGPITIRSAFGERGEHLGRGARLGEAFDLDALDRRLALVEDQELLQAAPARRACGPCVRTGSSHIGRTLAAHAEAARDLAPGRR